MIGNSGSANCYTKLPNCALYADEHCIECSDSYVLNIGTL